MTGGVLLLRCSLVLLQAFCNHIACTPPNKTPSKGRYETEGVLRMAPLVFKIHNISLWLSAISEVLWASILFYARSSSFLLPELYTLIDSSFCLPHRMSQTKNAYPSYPLSPMFVLGVAMVVLGSYVRVRCFQDLGKFFTFDLTIHPEHKLVRSGFYARVRHPSYTGSLLLIFGICASHLTPGSWAWECDRVLGPMRCVVLGCAWCAWTLAVGVNRAYTEDRELRKTFQKEWDMYAAEVRYWFVPGLL